MHVHLFRLNTKTRHWYAQVYVGSRRHRFTCHTANRATARQYAQRQATALAEQHDRGLIGLPEPVRISQVFDRYEDEELSKLRPASRRRTGGIIAQARSWFVSGPLRDPLLSHVRPDDVQAFLEVKRAEGVCARTVNLYRAPLHRIFRLCVRPWLLIAANPVAGTEPLRHDPREPHLLSEAEYDALRGACADHPMLSLFVTLAWETGARSAELLQLEWKDVDFVRRLLSFVNDARRGRQTKGRRSRTVPLSDVALHALRDHAARFQLLAPRSPFVFKHLRPNRSARPGDRLESLYLAFKRAAKAVDLAELRPHDLRHCFVTRKLAAGVPAQLVQHYVGHRTITMTMRYTHLVPEHLQAVVEEPSARVASSR